jgi:predicted nucleic acid-binding protein
MTTSAASPSTAIAGCSGRAGRYQYPVAALAAGPSASYVAQAAVKRILDGDETVYIAVQNLVEFWAVATRPLGQNGPGLSVEQATADLRLLEETYDLLPDVPLHSTWEYLVRTYRVSGKNAHDARLVAAMVVHGVGSILTFDSEFARYPFLTVLEPRAFA